MTRRRSPNCPLATGLLVAAAIALCAGGCAALGSSASGSRTACAGPPATTVMTPTVAILAQLGEPAPDVATARRKALAMVVQGATAMRAHVLLNGVGSGTDAPHLVVNNVLVGEGNNALFRQSDLDCKTKAITRHYDEITTGKTSHALDVVDALRALHADVETTPHGVVHVVLLSSLLSTVNADLTKHATLTHPAATINALARAGLNVRCEGWRVYAIGGTASDGTPLSGRVDSALQAFWRAYFKHCGGALVVYDTELADFPATSDAVAAADRTIIPLRVQRRAHAVVATLRSSVLFAIGSSILRPDASGELRKLLPLLADATRTVEVAGHTDDTGSDALNERLSRTRAAAVASWIRQNAGLATGRISARGFGATEPVASNRTVLGRARNRRVTVTIHAR